LGANPDLDGCAELLGAGQKFFGFSVACHHCEIVVHLVPFASAGIEINGEVADMAASANSSASKVV